MLEFHQAVNNGNILFSCAFESCWHLFVSRKIKIMKSDYFNLLTNRMKKQMKICRHYKGTNTRKSVFQRCRWEKQTVRDLLTKANWHRSVLFPLERKTKECNNNKGSTKRRKCWYLLNIIFVFAVVFQIPHKAGLEQVAHQWRPLQKCSDFSDLQNTNLSLTKFRIDPQQR